MSHKSELAISREQQLARLREATGTPERFVLDFACARHDRAFRVTFARFSPAQRFRCESVDKSESGQATTIERLQGLLRPAEALRVRTEDVDLSTVSCAWCAAGVGLDALRQMQNDDLRRPQLRPFFHLPRQLRCAIPDSPARCA